MDKSVVALKTWSREHISWFGQPAFLVRAGTGQAAFIDPCIVAVHTHAFRVAPGREGAGARFVRRLGKGGMTLPRE